jgi:tetratricopeptide (TPR) repeat protein
MKQHLTPQDLEAFAVGELPRDEARNVVAHLLSGCGACQNESAALWHLGQPQEALPADAYDAALDRVLTVLQVGRKATAEPAAAGWLQERAGVPADVQGPALVEALLQRAWDLRHESPDETRRISRLAVLAAASLSPETDDALDSQAAADLLSRASAGYGNACRIAGDLDEAQQALDRAAELLPQGTGDLGDRARLYEFQASLEAARGHYVPALEALDAAYALHFERGDAHLAGRDLITKGLYTGHMGRSRDAFHLTRRGLDMVDEAREPGLVLSAIHNQLWFLVESGRLREARSLLGAHRDRLATGETQRLDLLWLEGRIKAGLRNEAGGLRDLEAAEQGFTATGRRAQAANVKLDQAAVHLRQGDSARALALVRAAEEAFLQIDTPQSTRMGLAFLRRTLAERQIPAQFVLRLADIVRRGQREAAR